MKLEIKEEEDPARSEENSESDDNEIEIIENKQEVIELSDGDNDEGVDSDRKYYCKICPGLKAFKSKSNYYCHEKEVHKYKIHCPIQSCKESFMVYTQFKKHLENQHFSQKCVFCTDRYENQSELELHIREQHFSENSVKPVPSLFSQIMFKLKDYLIPAQAEKRAYQKNSTPREIQQCPTCKINFLTTESYELHRVCCGVITAGKVLEKPKTLEQLRRVRKKGTNTKPAEPEAPKTYQCKNCLEFFNRLEYCQHSACGKKRRV